MDSQVQEIKDRINIAEVIGQYVKLERAGRNMRARCPFHKEKTASFFVSPERGTYICFGCGERGDVFSFVQKMDGIDFSHALRQLAEKAGITLVQQQYRSVQNTDVQDRLVAVCEAATVRFESNLKEHKKVLEYLKERDVKEETISFWKLGYAPALWEDLTQQLLGSGFTNDELVNAGLAVRSEKREGDIYDRFRGRIMFPIFDTNGRVIAFSGRLFEETKGSGQEGESAKYVNSPETALFKKSRVLYGLNHAKQAIRRADCILLVEGQFDLILSHQSGLPFTVALSGTALTPEHLSLLGRLSKRLIIALDADPAGLRSGLKSAHMALSEGFDVKIPIFPEGKDPADIAKQSPEALKDAIRNSKPAIEFFLEALRPTAKDERGYKKIVEGQILPLVGAIGSRIDQSHFISLISQRLGVPEAAVQEEVSKIATSAQQGGSNLDSQEAIPLVQTPPSLERTAAMILFYYPPESAEVTNVEALLGEPRVAGIYQYFNAEAEVLRFEFEALGADTQEVTEGILRTIERGTIEETLHSLQQELRALQGREGFDETELLRKISSLKQRHGELRK